MTLQLSLPGTLTDQQASAIESSVGQFVDSVAPLNGLESVEVKQRAPGKADVLLSFGAHKQGANGALSVLYAAALCNPSLQRALQVGGSSKLMSVLLRKKGSLPPPPQLSPPHPAPLAKKPPLPPPPMKKTQPRPRWGGWVGGNWQTGPSTALHAPAALEPTAAECECASVNI